MTIVKPLEWSHHDRDASNFERWFAPSMLGTYCIYHTNDGYRWFLSSDNGHAAGLCETLDAAKAAAQADYAARILSALTTPADADLKADEDAAYEIGKRDGYSEAVQQIDQLTGGDGEYRYCTDHDPDRHTPGPAEMVQRIVDRFETLNLLHDAAKGGRDQEWGISSPDADLKAENEATPAETILHGLNEALTFSQVHARMIAAEAEIERLRQLQQCECEADEACKVLAGAEARATAAEAREKTLREALEFYADVEDYKAPFTGGMGKLWQDCGGVARAALKGGE